MILIKVALMTSLKCLKPHWLEAHTTRPQTLKISLKIFKLVKNDLELVQIIPHEIHQGLHHQRIASLLKNFKHLS